MHVDHRIARQHAGLHRLFHAVFDRRDEIARDRAALGGVDELKAAALLQRLDSQVDHAELSVTAALADETAFGLRGLANGLAVGDLRLADVGVDFEFAQQAIDDDLQVQFAHPGNQRLAGFAVDADAEGRVLVRELLPATRPSRSWSALVLGSIAIWMTGSGNSIDSSTIGCAGSQSVSPVVVSRRPDRADVAGEDLGDLLALVGVHLDQPADAFALAAWSS